MQPKAETRAMSEYGEPWRYLPDDQWGIIADCNGGVIVETTSGDILESDTARIVACVNAMQGIPNPEAVRAVLDAARLYCSPPTSGHPYAACDEQLDRLAVLKRAVASLSAPSGPQQK